MDSDSKSYQKDQSLTTSLSSTHETELDFEPVVISGLPDTAPSPAVPFTTTPHTIAVREVYDVTAPSPSSSSDGSSNEFVKVEHSDFHQSDGSVGDTLSFKMEQLLQLHKDDKNNQEREKDQNPVENVMDHRFTSEEPFSGILPRAEEFTESVIEKVTDIASTGAEKVVNVANKVMSDATKVTSEAFGNKTKEVTEQSGGKEYQSLEIPSRDTASNVLSGIIHGVSSAAEEARSMGVDVAHSLEEGVNKAVHTFKDEFDEHSARNRAVFNEPVHEGHQVADYPAQQWGLDWRQYTDQAGDISLGHPNLDTGVKEAVQVAGDSIHDQIIDVHDKVDSMIEKMFSATSPEHDDGGAEQSMFDRKGPLTIPHQTADDLVLLSGDSDSSKQSGFELSPRPPTPPKELDDEDVKPTTIDVGQTARKLSFGSEYPRSILKNSAQGVKFNLKDMDPRPRLEQGRS